MEKEIRMAGDYEIIHAVQIGDREIVVGENLTAEKGQKYMTAFCEQNDLFALHTEVLVSDDYRYRSYSFYGTQTHVSDGGLKVPTP